MVRHPSFNVCLLMFGMITLFSVAVAQDVTGTIEATVDGSAEPRVWSTLQYVNDDGEDVYTAEWDAVVGSSIEVVLEGFPEPELGVEGALELTMLSFDGLPEDCPCALDEVTVVYRSTGASFRDLFITHRGEATFTTFERLEEDVYRVEGTFQATLLFVEEYAGDPDPDRSMTMAGAFVIDRLPKE